MARVFSPLCCVFQAGTNIGKTSHKCRFSIAISEGMSKEEEEVKIIGSNKELIRQLKSLKTSPVPLPPFRNRHAETIFAAFFRTLPNVRYWRECLRMSDNGTVALDWPLSGEHDIWNTELPFDSPVLVLLPGLKGGSDDAYVRHMLLRARKRGWRPVVFNMRGCANSPVTTPKEGSNCTLSGAASLCNVFNMPITDEDLHKGFSNVYNQALARGVGREFKKHLRLFEGIGGEYDLDLTVNARSIREFDTGLTRVSFGFKSVDEYYAKSSSSDSIKHVEIPLLCIQAENDPIAPYRATPQEEIKENANCLLVVTPYGGHLGWVAGNEAPFGAPWTDPLVMEFFEVLEQGWPKDLRIELDAIKDSEIDSIYKQSIITKNTIESIRK
eukprot:TRINITY_DN3276_c0_g1_i3.p1 TRINITY_DN3276_c0_g1~~TRINITY_DN3276_c0_g1_i3.p1  ORF type:complete len:384 (+),score=49.73 TRINITY_DN3276_c0_g1_i3:235-1386(+)